jgi:ankyrin repeat protein
MFSIRFRWVFCQLEVLRYCFPTSLRRSLEELPKSLDGTYQRILNEINYVNRDYAYRLLQCLAVANRPLRVEELAEVLALDIARGAIPRLNADWRWDDQEEAILSACSTLVSVITHNGSQVVQFSHFSVKEFLTSDRLASSIADVSQFHIPLEPSHAILAQACLGTLLSLDDRTDRASAEKIPLLRYAVEYWDSHAQIGDVELYIKEAMDCFFDMDNPHFSAWVRIQGRHDLLQVSMFEQPRAVPPLSAPLYFAGLKGFPGLLERLIIRHPQQINHLGGVYGTPLHASVLGGHVSISQLLWVHGADINSRSADDWTPLHIASRVGHLEAGKWLLDFGAEVNVQKEGRIPLHFAASNGHLEVAQLLLERNAEVNALDDHGSTPLFSASENGHPLLVQLLLDHNADVYVRDNRRNTALHLAAYGGELKVVEILLKYNADVNSQSDEGSTPLHRAAEGWQGGHLDVVLFLLNHGADVSLRNLSGKTASEVAHGPDQHKFVQFLS